MFCKRLERACLIIEIICANRPHIVCRKSRHTKKRIAYCSNVGAWDDVPINAVPALDERARMATVIVITHGPQIATGWNLSYRLQIIAACPRVRAVNDCPDRPIPAFN